MMPHRPAPSSSGSRPRSHAPLIRRCLGAALAIAGGIVIFAGGAIAQILPLGQVLSFGDEGAEVELLQRELQRRGLFDGPISGRYLELTQDAVFRLQRQSGLTADGVFGPRTEDALFGRPTGIQTLAPVPDRPVVVGQLDPITSSPLPGEPAIDIEVDDVLAQLPDPSTAACSTVTAPENNLAEIGTFQRGDVDSGIRILQQRLTDLGFSTEGVDGIFGANTERAVILFQQSRNVTANGIVDEETARLLGLAIAGDEQPLINTGPYAVVVPADSEDLETLRLVRREVPRACFARSRMGSYIYAGGFGKRSSAESVSLRLRALDLDSRVDFRRRIRTN